MFWFDGSFLKVMKKMNKIKFNVFCVDYVRSLFVELFEREEILVGFIG